MKKEPIEQAAITALQGCLEKIPFLQIDRIESPKANNGSDIQVEVHVQGQTRLLLAQVKNNGQPRIARLAAYELKDCLGRTPDAYGIFIAPYISTEAGKICEDAGIGYLDLAGNCLLSFETIYIRQTGAPNPKVQKRDLRSLYSPKAERILRTMLTEPQRIWKTAELAQAAEISLGQVANVKKLLLDREWIRVETAGMCLGNPTSLLDEWAQTYNFQRNRVFDCYALAEIPEIEAQLAEACQQQGIRYALTGFSSAARISPMVRYQKASIYVDGDIGRLVKELDWKLVSSGANISLLLPYDDGVFYGLKDIDGIAIASPVQTFLDLQNYRGRGQEAAQSVRKEMEKTW